MASRKQLKKSIKRITGELMTDCVVLNACPPNAADKYQPLMAELLQLHTDYVSRLSHVEKGSERLFFTRLHQDFTTSINDLAERIVSIRRTAGRRDKNEELETAVRPAPRTGTAPNARFQFLILLLHTACYAPPLFSSSLATPL